MNNAVAKRIRRLMNKNSKFLLVPIDHGMSNGPIYGIENIRETVSNLIGIGVTGFIVHKGNARHIIDLLNEESLIIHLSAGFSISPRSNRKVIVTSVEEAISLGADAISVHVNIGNDEDLEMIQDLGEVVDQAHHYGFPLLAMMYARGPSIRDQYDPEILKTIARIADEAGSDIVKVYYTGNKQTFYSLVNSVRIPVVIAGGPKLDSEDQFIDMVNEAIQSGAAGLSIGRNIWQSKNPRELIGKILEIMG